VNYVNENNEREILVDEYQRIINRFRISVTSECNLNCFYCHHEGNDSNFRNALSLDQIRKIALIAEQYSIQEIKLTGGEPLMHPDIVEIVRIFHEVPSIKEISMTTNGLLLESLAKPLKMAGLDRLNIGCDSFSKSSVKSFTAIQPGLQAAKAAGFSPLKINMVLLKGINDHEVSEFISFAQKEGIILQIIELIKSNLDGLYDQYHISLDYIEKELIKHNAQIIDRFMHDRKQYKLQNGAVVELVKPVDNSHFCKNCKTLRITNDFKVQPCLNRPDLLIPIEDDINHAFLKAMTLRKPFNGPKC
jgi:cyclic pyranopterin phosphate synthase